MLSQKSPNQELEKIRKKRTYRKGSQNSNLNFGSKQICVVLPLLHTRHELKMLLQMCKKSCENSENSKGSYEIENPSKRGS